MNGIFWESAKLRASASTLPQSPLSDIVTDAPAALYDCQGALSKDQIVTHSSNANFLSVVPFGTNTWQLPRHLPGDSAFTRAMAAATWRALATPAIQQLTDSKSMISTRSSDDAF